MPANRPAVLKGDELDSVHSAAVALGLFSQRTALLGGVSNAAIAAIPIGETPGEQILHDLQNLGRDDLLRWLNNAILLSNERQEAAVFRRVRAQLAARAAVASAVRVRGARDASVLGLGLAGATAFVGISLTDLALPFLPGLSAGGVLVYLGAALAALYQDQPDRTPSRHPLLWALVCAVLGLGSVAVYSQLIDRCSVLAQTQRYQIACWVTDWSLTDDGQQFLADNPAWGARDLLSLVGFSRPELIWEPWTIWLSIALELGVFVAAAGLLGSAVGLLKRSQRG